MRTIALASVLFACFNVCTVLAVEKIIIDTDPAHGYKFRDVDDAFVIAIALNSPELEVVGITATFVNATSRRTYRKAVELLKAAGMEGKVPVMRGANWWWDHGKETDASRFIAQKVKENPGEITILAIGALTNVATALKDPDVAKSIKRIVTMGGARNVKHPVPPFHPIEVNWNFDPKSTRQVLESGVPIVQMSMEICTKVIFTPDHYRRLKKEAPFLRDYLAKHIRHWVRLNMLRIEGTPVPGFYPWDVVAIFYVLRPDAFDVKYYRKRMRGRIPPFGFLTSEEVSDAEEANVMAPSTFDTELFWKIFFERV